MTTTDLWGHVVSQLKEQYGWEPALLVGDVEQSKAMPAFAECPIYSLGEARIARHPDNIPDYEPRALDSDLLQLLEGKQAVLYELMSRFLVTKNNGSFDDRRRFYWEILRIWVGIFDTINPDIVIAASFPHRIFDYLIQQICEKRGIPFIALEVTSIRSQCYATHSFDFSANLFKKTVEANKNQELQLAPQLEELIENVCSTYEKAKPKSLSHISPFRFNEKTNKHTKHQKNISSQLFQLSLIFVKMTLKWQWNRDLSTVFEFKKERGSLFSSRLSKLKAWKHIYVRFKTALRINKLKKWYDKNAIIPNGNRKYIYFAPNYQPERSTCPDAGYFYDYSLILSILEATIPKDWDIYYKEHPRTFYIPIADDNAKDKLQYKRMLAACPRLKFIDRACDPFTLIDRAEAVSIVTGTTGWEALCRNKHVLLFGTAWYQAANFCYKITSNDDCAAAIRQIQRKELQCNNNIRAYLNAVNQCTVDLQSYFSDNTSLRATGTSIFAAGTNENGETVTEFAAKMAKELYNGYKRYIKNKSL